MNAPEAREVAPYLAQEAPAMPLAPKTQFSLAPRDLDQALRFAEILSKSNMVPKEFAGNPGNILVAVQWGMELGLQPMQAMQNIAVINGRPSLWGDAVIGLVKASPLCEYVVEDVTDTSATCRVKRRGEPEQSRTFTMDDAQKAGLKGKQGPWTQYPKRMMQMRARSWALRDVFPDVLRGMPVAEEVMDYQAEKEVNPMPAAASRGQDLPAYPADRFEHNLKKWRESGTKTEDEFIAMLSTKGVLSAEQVAEIRKGRGQKVETTGANGERETIENPGVTFASVESCMRKATAQDTLDVAYDLASEIKDQQQRAELAALYDELSAKFSA